jgi:recombination protein RecT
MADKKSLVLQGTANELNRLLVSKIDAMPNDFNQTRFLQNCMTVMQDTYNIETCQPNSIARTLLKGAFLGLDFFQKECYAIPVKGELQFRTDYKGETKLAKKHSIRAIKDIYAKIVQEGDLFEEEILRGQQSINFKPLSFNNNKIIGAFAVVLYQDNGMEYETMSTEEIENIKINFSQKSYKTGEYSKAWVQTPGEMYKKTVLRRLTKKIEKDFSSIEQAKIFEESSDMDFKKDKKVNEEVPDTFKTDKVETDENIIETNYEEFPEDGDSNVD